MRIHTDSFETVLPKERFFNPPKTKQAPKEKPWALVILAGILLVAMLAVTQPRSSSPAGVAPVVAPTPPPLPDPVRVSRAMPVPVTMETVPRAQLLHIRPIGVFENDRMPDGRLLGTTYRGELAGPGNLPRTGAQLGDMWYTRSDQHCWVLAPVTGGSAITGWVDP